MDLTEITEKSYNILYVSDVLLHRVERFSYSATNAKTGDGLDMAMDWLTGTCIANTDGIVTLDFTDRTNNNNEMKTATYNYYLFSKI